MEYFINLQDRSLVDMRLFLTDSKGRKLPPASGYKDNPSEAQANLGNRSFQAVIKVDIVQMLGNHNNRLQSDPIQYSVPPRFGTEPLKNLDYGESGHADRPYTNTGGFSKIKYSPNK